MIFGTYRFGHRRWLRISVGKGCNSSTIKAFLDEIHSEALLIGGHKFGLFGVDKASDDNSAEGKERGTLTLFAISGPGIDTLTVEEVQEWHQPSCLWKEGLSLHKYLKYQHHMFSDAEPTCTVETHDFEELEDIVSKESGDTMTDGYVRP